ncbi:restriction endonuclease [Roseobacter sp. N2S]|uniref:restriction endonuclease n=1 Tax=Roseobacter sp. N2S TaxID=2663844 RepID=UPI002857D20B|nr:restriction endonuclease [Roseobacter sp. N2S]MDR6267698.1 restriction system protein [Roseobacter sp. N2S]
MIPDYQLLMRPVLETALNGPRKISEVVSELEIACGLNEEEKAAMLPSGKQATFANRVHWARSYLKQAGLVKNIRRGWFELTDRGRTIAADRSLLLNSKFLERFEEFQEFKSSGLDDRAPVQSVEEPLSISATPDEEIQEAYGLLNDALAANLLDAVRSASPAFFERLIVELLIKMGYGGTSKDAGRALGQSGDNGVDGVIDQDPLGVDQLYLQAKRYQAGNSVGAGDIRDFFGALSLKKASKGLFVTTSSFTNSAEQTARDLGSRIVLLNGNELAKLMIRYGVGCREKEVLYIREMDEGFFDED